MSIEALKKLAQKAYEPTGSIVEILNKEIKGFRPARGYDTIHASDLTKSDFCPRMVALLDITGAKPKDEYLDAALAMTFDVGNATADLMTNKWAGQRVIGNWECKTCGAVKHFCPKPKNAVNEGCSHPKEDKLVCHWRHREIRFVHPEYKFSGSIDMLFDMGEKKLLMPVELKIVKPDEFETLAMPLAEHRLRTSLYLKLIAESNHPEKDSINQQEARVLYVSRGYGKKHAVLQKVLPMKEFAVKRDDGALLPYLQKAQAVTLFRDKKLIPKGICETSFVPRAKSCGVCAACFGGKYPATQL